MVIYKFTIGRAQRSDKNGFFPIFLNRKNVANVMEMETNISAAPMTGELTFSADASIEVAYDSDWSGIAEQLDKLADSLGVDILLDEEPAQ